MLSPPVLLVVVLHCEGPRLRIHHEMEWFLSTTLRFIRNTTFGLYKSRLNKRMSDLARKHHSNRGNHAPGGREGGITISRRPNKRPSREKAPGPSKAIAAAVMTIPKATSLASSIREGAGNHESAIPKQHSPTKSPAIGVRNPEARATPLATKVVPRNHVLEKALDDPRR